MMKIKSTPITMMFVLFLLTSVHAQRKTIDCEQASKNQTTSWGKQNIIIKKDEIFKYLHGKAVVQGKPLAGTLVEIYNNPEGLLMNPMEREARKVQQKRIAACVTGPSGKFSFSKILSGKYELRFSKPTDWDSTSVYVIVDSRSSKGTNREVIVRMQVSQ